MNHKSISIRKLLITVFLCFSLPAMLLLLVLSYFTIQRQSDAEVQTYQNNLSVYASNLERVLENTNSQLASIAYSNQTFQLFAYADTLYEKHQYASEIMTLFKH